MARYLVVVTLQDQQRYADLDRALILAGLETAVEPQGQSHSAFALQRGVYQLFSERPGDEVRDVVVGEKLRSLRLEGAVLVVELESESEQPVWQAGHAQWVPGGDQPVRS